jgi:serine/threonine protein phosphatase PrpC
MQPPTKKDVENWPKCSFFGVFDGHGGKHISTFLKKSLVKYYMNLIQ